MRYAPSGFKRGQTNQHQNVSERQKIIPDQPWLTSPPLHRRRAENVCFSPLPPFFSLSLRSVHNIILIPDTLAPPFPSPPSPQALFPPTAGCEEQFGGKARLPWEAGASWGPGKGEAGTGSAPASPCRPALPQPPKTLFLLAPSSFEAQGGVFFYAWGFGLAPEPSRVRASPCGRHGGRTGLRDVPPPAVAAQACCDERFVKTRCLLVSQALLRGQAGAAQI